MAFVVTRHFRTPGTDEPTTSRSFKHEQEARAVARAWAEEGWDVEMVSTATREQHSLRLETLAPMPPRAPDS